MTLGNDSGSSSSSDDCQYLDEVMITKSSPIERKPAHSKQPERIKSLETKLRQKQRKEEGVV